MIIGVLSDTHVPARAPALPREVLQGLAGVDLILHAGDLVDREILNVLREVAPVEAVAGNMDPGDLVRELGRKKVLTYGGFRIGLVHGDGRGAAGPSRAAATFAGTEVDCVVFGHTHEPYCARQDGILLFNPGSPTDKRWEESYSYGILRLGEQVRGEIIYFSEASYACGGGGGIGDGGTGG